jgi:hypothetical protein
MKMPHIQKKKPEALPPESVTLSGRYDAGVAPAGKHAPKQPYMAPSFTTTDVYVESFFAGTARIRSNSQIQIEDENDAGYRNDIDIMGL